MTVADAAAYTLFINPAQNWEQPNAPIIAHIIIVGQGLKLPPLFRVEVGSIAPALRIRISGFGRSPKIYQGDDFNNENQQKGKIIPYFFRNILCA